MQMTGISLRHTFPCVRAHVSFARSPPRSYVHRGTVPPCETRLPDAEALGSGEGRGKDGQPRQSTFDFWASTPVCDPHTPTRFYNALAVDPALRFASFRIVDARARATGRNPLPRRSPGRFALMRIGEPCPFMGLIQVRSAASKQCRPQLEGLDVPSTYQAIDALPLPERWVEIFECFGPGRGTQASCLRFCTVRTKAYDQRDQ